MNAMPTKKKTTKKTSKKKTAKRSISQILGVGARKRTRLSVARTLGARPTRTKAEFPVGEAIDELGESIHRAASGISKMKGVGAKKKQKDAYRLLLDARAKLASIRLG